MRQERFEELRSRIIRSDALKNDLRGLSIRSPPGEAGRQPRVFAFAILQTTIFRSIEKTNVFCIDGVSK